MSKPVCLIVCTGKDCRKDKGFNKLIQLASDTDGAMEAPCQGLCHGPIVAVRDGDGVRWYSKIRSKSMRKRLARRLRSGCAPTELAEHEVKQRRNTIRGSRRLKPLHG